MPNWITTNISVTGEGSLGKKLSARCYETYGGQKSEGVSLSNFVDLASPVQDSRHTTFPSWYWRNIRLLGTKWDSTASGVVLSQTDVYTYNLDLIFETANSHPFESVIGMAEQFFLIDNSLIMNVEFSDEQPDQNFGAYRISTSKDNPNLFCSEGFHVGFIGYADSADVGPLRGQIKHLESSTVCCSWPKIFQREKRFLAGNT